MEQVESFCRALAEDEPLLGTGHDGVHRWVLVEDAGPWGAKVPRDTKLPGPVRERLEHINADPGTRVQLIRRPGRRRAGPRRKLFVVEAPVEAEGRRIASLDVGLDALASLDPDALVAEAPATDTNELASLWLVCTHGARDRCCAKWGVALWEALRRLEHGRVWQSSHLGGHRFAPTLVTLPGGLLWGRVAIDELERMRASLGAGRLAPLERFRGRCAYPRAVQAAECVVRTREGLHDDAALTLLGVEGATGDRARVTFRAATGALEATVEQVMPGFASPSNCGEPSKARPYYREASAALSAR